MRSSIVIVLLMFATVACAKPATDAPAEIRSQYLTIARIAANRTGLDISDADWMDFANLVCRRSILDQGDYDELIRELQNGAPTPELGRASRDVGRSAISLFCPPDF